jgi:hypothetical protein
MFAYTERRGLHVIPVHYYSPIPDTHNLSDGLWTGCLALPSVEINVDVAAEWLDTLMQKYARNAARFQNNIIATIPTNFC